jgi:hypothetical protein
VVGTVTTSLPAFVLIFSAAFVLIVNAGQQATAAAPAGAAPADQRPSGSWSWLAWTGGIALLAIAAAGGAFLLWRRRTASKT